MERPLPLRGRKKVSIREEKRTANQNRTGGLVEVKEDEVRGF